MGFHLRKVTQFLLICFVLFIVAGKSDCSSSSKPFNLQISIDTSGSMKSAFANAQTFLKTLVASLPLSTKYSILPYDIIVELGLSQFRAYDSLNELNTVIDNLKDFNENEYSNSSLVLDVGLKLFNNNENNALLLITDTKKDEVLGTCPKDSDIINNLNIRTFIIGISHSQINEIDKTFNCIVNLDISTLYCVNGIPYSFENITTNVVDDICTALNDDTTANQLSSPTTSPSLAPTITIPDPTETPTIAPTITPSSTPTSSPTSTPSDSPTLNPTVAPSITPSSSPSVSPTIAPSFSPITSNPTLNRATSNPTKPGDTKEASITPTISPTLFPTISPTKNPSIAPTKTPSISPTLPPTLSPIADPTVSPSLTPSDTPSIAPTLNPITSTPTSNPITSNPTKPGDTIEPTTTPSVSPTNNPTVTPIKGETLIVSKDPTKAPVLSIGNAQMSGKTKRKLPIWAIIVGVVGGFGICCCVYINCCKARRRGSRYERVRPHETSSY